MFAGHIGAALAIGRSEPRLNVGVFVIAALLLDIVLWLFVLLGWESVVIPADFSTTHQPEFVFPFSHGLVASVAWSAAAGFIAFAACSHLGAERFRVALLVAAAVFSHWLLDALVHRPELPIAGKGSTAVGLGLWNSSMGIALAVEALVLISGLAAFWAGVSLSRARKAWCAVLCLLVLAFTVAGMTVAPPPPSAKVMAFSSLVIIALVCALLWWLARRSQASRPHFISGCN